MKQNLGQLFYQSDSDTKNIIRKHEKNPKKKHNIIKKQPYKVITKTCLNVFVCVCVCMCLGFGLVWFYGISTVEVI